MQIDVTQPILGLDDEQMSITTGLDAQKNPIVEKATLRLVMVCALWHPQQGEEKLPADKQILHRNLARRINKEDSIDLPAEHIALIKERIPKAFTHVGIVAGALELIDPPAQPSDGG